MPTVEIIEPTIYNSGHDSLQSAIKKRVAAYARVSTDQDEQMTSYGNQIEYYT